MPKSKYAVLGSYADTGQIFNHEVEATDAFNAFALIAQEHETAEFIAAVKLPAKIEYPGEGVVCAQTVRDQKDVFPL